MSQENLAEQPEVPVEAVPPANDTPDLAAEVTRLKDELLRAHADVQNVVRRAAKEREDTSKFAINSFAKEVLTVADNLRRALDAAPADGLPDAAKNILTGVEATERHLLSVMERFGIRKMEPKGQPFNPELHQVMVELENTGNPPGTVVQVMQTGYTIHGRLLREAMVAVAKGEQPEHINTVA